MKLSVRNFERSIENTENTPTMQIRLNHEKCLSTLYDLTESSAGARFIAALDELKIGFHITMFGLVSARVRPWPSTARRSWSGTDGSTSCRVWLRCVQAGSHQCMKTGVQRPEFHAEDGVAE